MVVLLIALFVVGARWLEHLRYLAYDPLVARLCGLAQIPTDCTVVNWLKQFTQEALQAVITLNSELRGRFGRGLFPAGDPGTPHPPGL